MKKNRLLAMLLSASMMFSLAIGCAPNSSSPSTAPSGSSDPAQSGSGEETPGQSNHLTIGVGADVESFNPWLMAQDTRQQVYYNNIYEPLARLTLEGNREFVIAESLESKGDGLYVIKLHDNVYDSKGNNITADDIIFSYNGCLEAGQLAWGIKYLDHFEKVNDYTLNMYLNQESAVAVDMVLKTVFIVSQKSYEESPDGFATEPVGTGPYVLKNYVPGSEIVIEAREDYWQTDASQVSTAARLGSVKTITYRVITDASQRALMLETGDIDGSLNIATTDLNNFLNDDRTAKDGYNVSVQLSPLVHYIAYNCSDNSPCADIRVRQAISYAIDVPAIVANVYGSDAETATTNSSRYYGDYDPSLNDSYPYEYDADKAKQLLADAGYGDGELSLNLIYKNEYQYPQVATLVQSYLRAVGINAEINSMESALYNTSINDSTAFDMYINCIMSLNTPGRLGLLDLNQYTMVKGYDGTSVNGVFVNDPTLQEKFDAANLLETYSTETVTDLLEYIEEKDYTYPMFYFYQYFITNDRVTDIVLDRNFALIPGASTVTE